MKAFTAAEIQLLGKQEVIPTQILEGWKKAGKKDPVELTAETIEGARGYLASAVVMFSASVVFAAAGFSTLLDKGLVIGSLIIAFGLFCGAVEQMSKRGDEIDKISLGFGKSYADLLAIFKMKAGELAQLNDMQRRNMADKLLGERALILQSLESLAQAYPGREDLPALIKRDRDEFADLFQFFVKLGLADKEEGWGPYLKGDSATPEAA